ncbi:MAG TPA: TonB-dependent receptor [Melioribacteraceae bacterium]|nr:TonB-dependent receptor [Melioribacteraceae bacterium]
MKKLFVLTIVAFAGILKAQPDSLKNYLLGEIIVSARNQEFYSDFSQLSIELNQIKAKDPESITDVLNNYTGIFIKYSSRNEAVVNIRGYDQRQIAVFFDGVPIYVPYDGLVDLNKIPIVAVNKISVNKSIPSMLYGANTMGGTINIVSGETRYGISSRLKAQTGESNYFSAENGGSLNNFFWQTSASYSKTKGFSLPADINLFRNENGGMRDNSQRNAYSAFLKLGYRFNEGSNIALSYYHNNNTGGVPVNVYTVNPRYWRFTEWNKSIINFMYQTVVSTNLRIKGNIFLDKYKNVLDSYDDASYTLQTKKYAFHSTYDDYSLGGNLFVEFDSGIIAPTKFAVLYKKDLHKEQGNTGSHYSQYENDTYTLGLEQEIPLSNSLLCMTGLNYDLITPVFANNSPLRNRSAVLNGYIGINYKVSEPLRAHIYFSNRSRFPTLKELYSEVMGKNIANPDLAAEKSTNTEIGLKYLLGQDFSIETNFFLNKIKDLIEITNLPENKRQFQNIGQAEVKGIEVGLTLINSFVNLNAAYTYMSADNKTPLAASTNLKYKPKHMLHISLNRAYLSGFAWHVESSYFGRQFGIEPDILSWVNMPDYLILNLRASYKLFNELELFVRINNLLDKYYESEYGYPQPGRNILLGIDLTL